MLKEEHKGYKKWSSHDWVIIDINTRKRNLCLDFARKCVNNKNKHKFVQKVAKKIILLISFGVKQG